MVEGSSKSMCANRIHNILKEYEDHLNMSEIDVEDDFQWEKDMNNYIRQRDAFCNVYECQNSAKDVSDTVECFELFTLMTWFNMTYVQQ
jgi:hypothetical protein